MEKETNSPEVFSSNLWESHNPVKVRFGRGVRASLHSDVATKRVLAVSSVRGREQFGRDPLLRSLEPRFTWIDSVTPNPTIATIEQAREGIEGYHFDCAVAFGGGSALDFAKALSALLRSPKGTGLESLIADPQSLDHIPTFPFYAIPTTSGTGSEVTPFATIWDDENKRKLSLSSQSLFPTVAIVDPELADSNPMPNAFASGLDALNQAFEAIWNKNQSPITNMIAPRAASLALKALPSLYQNSKDLQARSKLSEASLLAGICISQTRTAICHSVSYPITAHFGVPHGIACAFAMGEILNLCVSEVPDLLETVASINGNNSLDDLSNELQYLLSILEVSEKVRRSTAGVQDILNLRAEMITPGRSDNFVLDIDDELMIEILTSSYEQADSRPFMSGQ